MIRQEDPPEDPPEDPREDPPGGGPGGGPGPPNLARTQVLLSTITNGWVCLLGRLWDGQVARLALAAVARYLPSACRKC